MSKDRARSGKDWYDEDDADMIQDEHHVPVIRRAPPARPVRPAPGSRPGRSTYPPVPERQRRSQPPRKERRAWPFLLLGCAGGIVLVVLAAAIVVLIALRSATGGNLGGLPGIMSARTYTQQNQQAVPMSTITQLQVNNQIGNIVITVDPSATTPTITTVKKVKASSSSDASNEFTKISVQVRPVNTTLSISATVPTTGSILFGSHNDSVDITLALPQSLVASTTATTATAPLALNLNTSIGNISTSGLSGLFTLKDDVGDITVSQATLFDGSHLETGTGNVNFDGAINTTPASGNSTPRYKLQSETGNITVTLPANTNVILDANTNIGKITSDFPINVTTSQGGANYYGPLLSNPALPQPQAVLTLDVSTGNVTIHQA